MPKISFRHVDRAQTLRWRIDALKGFATLVPPLVEADRNLRYEWIKKTNIGADEEDLLALYEQEAGSEEGDGHADFERTCLSAAVVFAWDVFFAYLATELIEFENGSASPAGRRLAASDIENIRDLRKRWRMAGVELQNLMGWDEIDEFRLLRNALVHNGGRYTDRYLHHSLARRDTEREQMLGSPISDDFLIDLVEIPLSVDYVRERLDALINVFIAARTALMKHPGN